MQKQIILLVCIDYEAFAPCGVKCCFIVIYIKMNLKTTLISTVIILSSLTCAAQGVVSLDSCRTMALHNNKLLRTAEQNITGAGYAVKAAKAAYLPAFDLTAGYAYNQHRINLLGEDAKLPTMIFDPATQSYRYDILLNPVDGQPILNPETGAPIPSTVAVIPKSAMSYDVHNTFVGAITVMQPVYMGGAIRAMNDITRYAEQLARSSRNSAAQDVVYAVDETYWLVVSLKQKKRLAESFVQLIDTLKYNVNQMYEQGVATRSDCLQVEVKYNEACVALTKADNGLTLSRMALAQICGLPLDSHLILADEDFSDSKAIGNSSMTPIDATDMENVYAHRQDLQSMRTGIKILESTERLVKADMMPKIAVMAAYKVTNPNVIDGFEKRFGGGFNIGATLTMPLWHWGANSNKLKAAQSATIASRLQLEDACEKVNLQVQQARFRYEESFKTLDMTRVNLRSADENLENAQYGFSEGVLTTDDVIAAQTAWLKAHSENIDAQIDVQLCRVYLSKVLGTMNY